MCIHFDTILETNVGIIERFGQFQGIQNSGCFWYNPCITNVAAKLSLKIKEYDLSFETITMDNAFVFIHFSIEIKIIPNEADTAYYSMKSPIDQIKAYVFNSMRKQLTQINIIDIYSQARNIGEETKKDVFPILHTFGYEIISVLIQDIQPVNTIKMALNNVEYQKRLLKANIENAEMSKMKIIKRAEGESESKRLYGLGFAEERKAIVDGFKTSIDQFKNNNLEINNDKILYFLLWNQHLDMLHDIGSNVKNKVMKINHNGGISDLVNELNNMPMI